MDNKPVVGLVGTVDIHFGMLGHGSFFGGGDRDIALTRSVMGGSTLTDEGFEWNLPVRDAPYYKLADYANDVPGFAPDVRRVDQADGKLDGKWRDNDIDQLLQGFDTPARTPYQERVVETVIKNEGFGNDDTPDLLYLNFKEIDYVSHVWSMNSPEMSDAVVAQDLALKRFVAFLNKQVGKGKWAMVLTADHGAMPDPAVCGGFQIQTPPIQTGINENFDKDGEHPRRRARAALTGVPERPGARAERVHGGRRRSLRHDAHPGPDGVAHANGRSRDRERPGVRGRVPVGPDAASSVSPGSPSRRLDPPGRMSPAWR